MGYTVFFLSFEPKSQIVHEARKLEISNLDRLENAFSVVKKATESINSLQSTADRRVEAREESVIRKTVRKTRGKVEIINKVNESKVFIRLKT